MRLFTSSHTFCTLVDKTLKADKKSIYITNRGSQASKNITKRSKVSAKIRMQFEVAKRNNASSLDSTETQVKIIDESDQEVEVYRLKSYGVGLGSDCYSKNIVVSVHVLRIGHLTTLGTHCLPPKNGQSKEYEHIPLQFRIYPCRFITQSKQWQLIICQLSQLGKGSLP